MEEIIKNKGRILNGFFKTLTEIYGMYVIVKDFSGFLDNYPAFKAELEMYLVHNAPFCMSMKYANKKWDICLDSTLKLSAVCNAKKRAFYGVCPFGIGEYTVPILYEGVAVGAICCGAFEKTHGTAEAVFKNQAKTLGLDYEKEFAELSQMLKGDTPNFEHLEKLLEFASDFISGILREDKSKMLNPAVAFAKKNYIVLGVTEYICQYYAQEISLDILSENFRCSKSYISHEFKKGTGQTLKEYLNKIRLEVAEELLKDRELSITAVALQSGYTDPDYFTMLFKNKHKLSPIEYRKNLSSN